MALMQCHFFSECLGQQMTLNAVIPQPGGRRQIGQGAPERRDLYPTLYLLHGLSDDHTIWLRRTSIERYAAELGLAIVMPAGHRSFYTDAASGVQSARYWTYVSEEIPALAEDFFPLSRRREDRFVAGLSMGGYGAFKLGLRRPDLFAAVASLSGALDVTGLWRRWSEQGHGDMAELAGIFGSQADLTGSDEDLFHLASHLAGESGPRPMLMQCCGTEDFLYADNLAFRNLARELGLALEYHEGPGVHNWAYWDQEIQRVLKWLPLGGK